MKATVRRLLAVTATTALAASLAACGPNAQQDNATAPAAATPAAQPGWSMSDLAQVDPQYLNRGGTALPRAEPMRTSYSGNYRQAPIADYSGGSDVAYAPDASPDDYQYLGMAAGLTGMLGDAPPDYGFDYGDVRPWGWETADHYVRYAEPVSGGYRYYYYQPDSARPFLISDPYYSYGYRDGDLVTIYDRSGRLIDARRAARERQAAQNYYARAAEMYQAAHREQRFGVAAPLWQQHRDEIAREQRQLDEARRQRQQWQQWDARNDPQLQRDWASEALVRRHAETSFSGWQQADFRTPPPRLYSQDQQRADLQQLANIRRQQEAQRAQLANRAADQRATQQQQQAEAQKLAQQRQAVARQQQAGAQQLARQRQALAQQQAGQQNQARDQRAEQARLQAQHQQQLAQANAVARQKASLAQAAQAAQQRAQLAKADAQRAAQAKAAAARQAAGAADARRKAEQAQLAARQRAEQASAAKLAEQKARQAAEQSKVRDQRAEQAKLHAQHQQQLAEANAAARQKALAAQAKQAAEQRVQLAKADAQRAEQAKAAAARQAAAAANDRRKAEQAQLAAEQRAKQASLAKQAALEHQAQARAAQAGHQQQQARKAAAAGKGGKPDQKKHDDGQG